MLLLAYIEFTVNIVLCESDVQVIRGLTIRGSGVEDTNSDEVGLDAVEAEGDRGHMAVGACS